VILFYATKLRQASTLNKDIDTSTMVGGGENGRCIVIKAVPLRGSMSYPLREIAAMQHVTGCREAIVGQDLHPYHNRVIPLLDCMQDDSFVYMVLPYLHGGDLFNKIKSRGHLPQDQTRRYFQQITQGMLYMQQSGGIAHQDISPENVMFDGHGDACLIDLGLSLRVPKEEEGPVRVVPQRCRGKRSYVAPEMVLEVAYDPYAADVWSLGVCLYVMLTGSPLYNSPGDTSFRLMAHGGAEEVITHYQRNYGLVVPPAAKELLYAMLHANPSHRPSLEEILQHDFTIGKTQ